MLFFKNPKKKISKADDLAQDTEALHKRHIYN